VPNPFKGSAILSLVPPFLVSFSLLVMHAIWGVVCASNVLFYLLFLLTSVESE